MAVEPGAGRHARHADDDYRAAGAEVAGDAIDNAEVLLGVQARTVGR